MAAASRTFSRALRTAAPSFRSTTTRSARSVASAQNAFRGKQWQRGYATDNEAPKDKYEGKLCHIQKTRKHYKARRSLDTAYMIVLKIYNGN